MTRDRLQSDTAATKSFYGSLEDCPRKRLKSITLKLCLLVHFDRLQLVLPVRVVAYHSKHTAYQLQDVYLPKVDVISRLSLETM